MRRMCAFPNETRRFLATGLLPAADFPPFGKKMNQDRDEDESGLYLTFKGLFLRALFGVLMAPIDRPLVT